MNALNYYENSQWEYLFSGETGIKDMFHPGPYSLRYDKYGNSLVNADCREANGLLYTGTDYLTTENIFGAGEYEISLDPSVTGSNICFWAFDHPNQSDQNKANFPGYGFETQISRDGNLSIIDHYRDDKLPTDISRIGNTHSVILNLTAIKQNSKDGFSFELYFYIDKNLVLRYVPDFFNQGRIIIKGGIYRYIKFRGEYKLPYMPPYTPPGRG